MPADELTPRAGLAPLDILRSGEVEVLGRMPWSSNATMLVDVRADGGCLRAVYKPRRGERPLWDFPRGLYRREVATAVVGIVRDQDVPGKQAVLAEELDCEAHRQRGRQHELRDADGERRELPRRVENRRVPLVRLVQDRRRRGERDVRRHLVGDGLHRAADHLGGHRIDAAGLPHATHHGPLAAGL